MKLRSGKIIKQPLPKVLEEKLNEDLSDFKALLANNEHFAKELIKTITFGDNHTRIKVSDMIREVFFDVALNDGLESLLSTSGSLLRIVVGNDIIYKESNIPVIYHEAIQERMLDAFDLDLSLIGSNIEID